MKALVETELFGPYPDKDNNYPLLLNILAGKMTKRNIISGAIAKKLGLEAGKYYVVKSKYTGLKDTFGKQVEYKVETEITTIKAGIGAYKLLGEAEVVK